MPPADVSDNSVVATTHTDRYGNYQYSIADGLGAGRYKVVQVPPTGWVQTTADPGVLAITRGETFIRGINFGDYHPTPSPTPIVGDTPLVLPDPGPTPATADAPQSKALPAPAAPAAAPLPAGPSTTPIFVGTGSLAAATESDAPPVLLGVDLTTVDFV